jgi:SAM-dependent methyltransferase
MVRRVRAAVASRSRDPEMVRYERLSRLVGRIRGWCHPVTVPVWDGMLGYQRRSGVRGHLLEIGVLRGKSAAVLAAHVDPESERLFLVDPSMDASAVRRTLRRVRPAAERALVLLREKSHEVLAGEAGGSRGRFRWIHIDGDHSAACVLEDLATANDLLSPDGVVVLDDFFVIDFPHLTEATFRYLAQHPTHFSLFLVGGRKGYLARPGAAPHYRYYCLRSLIADLEARDVEMTLRKPGQPGELDCFALLVRQVPGQRLRGLDSAPGVIHTEAWPFPGRDTPPA